MDSSFWENVLANFIADLAVAILMAIIIGWFISRITKKDARVIAYCELTDESTVKLELAIENTGRVIFKSQEIYYFIFIEGDLTSPNIKKESGAGSLALRELKTIQNKTFTTFKGLPHAPVFPSDRLRIFSLHAEKLEIHQKEMYYCLSTVYGVFPKRHKDSFKAEDLNLETLGKVQILSDS